MKEKQPSASIEKIERSIHSIRGQRIMLDVDLARIYGVETKALNRAVKRNADRFPSDFMFRLTTEETLRCQFGAASKRNVRYLPYAFTEHGALMLASVLNSPIAVRASVQVVRAFVRLRELLTANKELAQKLAELEKGLADHDGQIRALFARIRDLMNPPEPPRRQIGFRVQNKS